MEMRSEREQSAGGTAAAVAKNSRQEVKVQSEAGGSFALVFFTAASRIKSRIRDFYTVVENWGSTPTKSPNGI